MLLTACSRKALLGDIAPQDDRALSARVIADLQGRPGGDADLITLINPQLRTKIALLLPKMRFVVPAGPSRLGPIYIQDSQR